MQINILEYLERTVQRLPDKAAFCAEEETLTFSALSRAARAIGSRLCREGCCHRPVVVFMKKRPLTIAAFLGVIYAGGYYVPLDPEMPRNRIRRILQDLHPAAWLCGEDTITAARELEPGGTHFLCGQIADGEIDDRGLAEIRSRQIDTDPIYIVFTSGSTGVPKGVIGCHRAVIDYIENLCPVLGFHQDTIFGNQTPLYFDACLKEILPTLKYGATTYLIPQPLFLFPVKLMEYLNRNRINTLCWVASALSYISALGTFDTVLPEHLETVAFASEVFPTGQLNLWRTKLPKVRFFNLYGPTEATGICCYYEVERTLQPREPLPIGRPFPNTRILLLDEQGRSPVPGSPGEICIQGSRLTLGYYGLPERTAEAFPQNSTQHLYPERIYRTGDLGMYNSRGELLFLGRKDHQIKHMGRRIELGEIEAAANACPGLHAACCVYTPGQQPLHLYYTGTCSPAQLKSHLKENLPRYMLPHRVTHLSHMPLTPNGKLDRNQLTQRSTQNG